MPPPRPSVRGRVGRLLCLCLVVGAERGALGTAVGVLAAEAVSFPRQIRPLFAEHCLHCHGPDAAERQAELRLDDEASAKLRVVVPFAPEKSELLRRLTTDDPDERMPPPGNGPPLAAAQIERVRQWIAAGAPYADHWAFAPVVAPPVPPTAAAVEADVDRFVGAALEARGMSLAPPLAKTSLIRRATFDLTGLPPEWPDVEAFLNDDSPEAFARVVDRLLASPQYGERWGRHWLDLARYADTHGGSAIGFVNFPFSYAYRDYVIRALNADVPYDRFLREQLAADQLGLSPRDPALAALGFLTVGMQFRNRHDRIDDQIDVATRGLMGLTVACARCHDHKYDPVSIEDYYSLYAALAGSTTPDELPFVGDPPATAEFAAYAEQLARLRTDLADATRDQAEILRGRLRMQVGLYLAEIARDAPEQDLSSAFLSYRTDDVRPAVLERWRGYLARRSEQDPVWGPWVRLRAAPAGDFPALCRDLVARCEADNGAPAAAAAEHDLGLPQPRWNPRVLAAIGRRAPQSLRELAEVYGELFADVQRQWLDALREATLEAAGPDRIVPDEDPRHAAANSAVLAQLRRHLYASDSPAALSDDEAAQLLNRSVRDKLGGKSGAIHALHLSSPGSPPRAMALEEAADAGPFHVFRRGNPLDRGPAVEPRFPAVLAAAAPQAFPPGRRRLALAEALVDPHNPLTRRVVVNWVWQHHFGAGLVRTPDDFGARGEPPTHPELLDRLAATLYEEGWSLKRLHRRIMLSRTYQQAARERADYRNQDPDNRLLWRMPRRPLTLEAMRDAMLAVSGELDLTVGGRPFELAAEPCVPRRTVYALVNRDVRSPLSTAFDGANPNSCTLQRPATLAPQQTLFLLNSSFVQDRAAAWARRVVAAEGEDERQRVARMFRQAYSREPSADEAALALRYVAAQSADPGDAARPEAAWQRLAHALLASSEFLFVD